MSTTRKAKSGMHAACLAVAAYFATASIMAAEPGELNPAPPDGQAAELHLERGLEYFAQGEFARAVIEFEQVLQFDYLAMDARERAETYARAARRYQRGERLTFSGFAQSGVGYYRENTTDSTTLSGGAARDPFMLMRANGRLSYLPGDDLSFDGTLDYRFRHYDTDSRRNDSDLRWSGAARRSLLDGSRAVGIRGRASYRGNATYRQDFGAFMHRGYVLDSDNSLRVEADLRRRQYQSALRERSHTNADLGLTWTRAERDGRASLSVNIKAGYEWRRSNAPDGNATVYGLSADWSKDLGPSTSLFLFGWYEHNGFHDDRVVVDEIDAPVGVKTRADDLFEFGGGLVLKLGDGWTLRPEILYTRDESNDPWANYAATELWVALRRDF